MLLVTRSVQPKPVALTSLFWITNLFTAIPAEAALAVSSESRGGVEQVVTVDPDAACLEAESDLQ